MLENSKKKSRISMEQNVCRLLYVKLSLSAQLDVYRLPSPNIAAETQLLSSYKGAHTLAVLAGCLS